MLGKNLFIYLFIFTLFVQYSSANSKIINIDKLINTATLNNKQVMIFFHMKNCGYCERMKNITFKNKEIKEILKKEFLDIDINIDNTQQIIFKEISYSTKEFLNTINVDFFPTILFLDYDYEITYTVRGYRDKIKFKKILQFMQTKSYDSMDFFDYNQQKIEKE